MLKYYYVWVMGLAGLAPVCFGTPGQLDTSFGGNGTVQTDINGGNDNVFVVLAQQDGKVILGGNASLTGADHDYALMR